MEGSSVVDSQTRSSVLSVLWASDRKVGVPGGRHWVRSWSAVRWRSDSVSERALRSGKRLPDQSGWCLLKSPMRSRREGEGCDVRKLCKLVMDELEEGGL